MTVRVLVETLVVRHIVRLSMDESTHGHGLAGGTIDGWMEGGGSYEGDEGCMFDSCRRSLAVCLPIGESQNHR